MTYQHSNQNNPNNFDVSEVVSKCNKCGISGIHACTGSPIPPMSDHDRQKLNSVMNEVFPPKTDNHQINS